MTSLALPGVLDSATLLASFGLMGILLVVFAETGLLVGFFLPGDSLLFTAGLLATGAAPFAPLWVLLLSVPIVAILGDQVGYQIGRRAGRSLYSRPNSRFFKQAHLKKAHAFFDRHGPKTVALARVIPVIRTFIPTVAGASGMPPVAFLKYNVLGGVLWGAGVTTAGYLLGDVPFVRDHIEMILVLVVLISVVPIIVHLSVTWLRSRKVRTSVRGSQRTFSGPQKRSTP